MQKAHRTTFTVIHGGKRASEMRETRRRALTAILWLSALILAGIVFELVLS